MPADTTYYIYTQNSIETVNVNNDSDTTVYIRQNNPQATDDSFVSTTLKDTYRPFSQPLVTEKHYSPGPVFLIIFFSIFIIILWNVRRDIKKGAYDESDSFDNNADDYKELLPKPAKPTSLTYYGDELNFSTDQYSSILIKHFPYFNKLNEADKTKFIYKIKRFIEIRTFKIHAESGFKEMPVLISAAAVQLTFGLKNYLLPNFEYIHIFPQEFLRVEPILCFLEGNVSGHSINISWKHFLEDLGDNADGKNVGLHEMGHALYYQNFVANEDVDENFKRNFYKFNVTGTKVFEEEKNAHNGIYSSYACSNFQEFWAESVELFFEKPAALNEAFPELCTIIGEILNQPFDNTAS